MYSREQRELAIETFIKFDYSVANTIRKLGYPNRTMLYRWWNEYQQNGGKLQERKHRRSKYSDEKKQAAVDYYLEHGKNVSETIRAMGYPCRPMLCNWVDELAPGQRKHVWTKKEKVALSIATKVQAVAELESRSGTAKEVADKYGVSRITPYFWRRKMLEHNDANLKVKGEAVSKSYDDLPDDIETLKGMKRDLKEQVRMLQLEIEVRQATLEILKKRPGHRPEPADKCGESADSSNPSTEVEA